MEFEKICEVVKARAASRPRRKDLDDEKINELRRQRDEYNNKASEIQKQIDQACLDFYQVPDVANKYITYTNDNGESYIVRVVNIARLFQGVRLEGPGFITGEWGVQFNTSVSINIPWDRVEDIVIICQSDFESMVEKIYKDTLLYVIPHEV